MNAAGNPRVLQLQWRPKEIVLLGQRAIVTEMVVPPDVEVPDDLATAIRLRKLVYEGGTCVCGAKAVLPPRAARRRAVRLGLMIEAEVNHAPHCLALLRGWSLVDGGPV